MNARRLTFVFLGTAALATTSLAQVPDLLNALDAGGRSMGAGGAFYPTGSDTLSSYYNPAGLGYISRTSLGLSFRNMPTSRTTASGQLNDPTLDSKGASGRRDISHFGIAMPLGRGNSGSFGISYTVGGFIDDTRTGNVSVGPDTVSNYLERIQAKIDFFTFAFGKSSGSTSWGVGAQVVQAHINDRRQGTTSTGGNLAANPEGTTFGVAGIVGLQITPRGQSNVSYGFSYRSEVNLSDNSQTSPLLDKIPARLMGGVAFRQDGARGGKDFLLYGLQVAHYFGHSSSDLFSRKAQTTAGFGLEYNYGMNGARIPIRFGYNMIPSGGNGYGERNALTFGIGYRPANGNFLIDLNMARSSNGGSDLGLSLGYLFPNK